MSQWRQEQQYRWGHIPIQHGLHQYQSEDYQWVSAQLTECVCVCVFIIYYLYSAHLNISIIKVNPLKSKSDPFLYPLYPQERVT